MMSLRAAAFVLLVAGAAAGQSTQAPRGRGAAPPPEIGASVQISPGADLAGPWQTFVVELDSKTTRELDLTVTIEDESYLAVAARRERLSPGARKRLFLYSPGSLYPRGIPPRWKIRDRSGRELADGLIAVTLRGYVSNPYQVGLFSRTAASSDDFGFPSGLNGQEIRFGRITTATFPDRWIGLSSLDLLVIHDAALDELTTDQARALSEFVRMGGSVLLSPGATKGWFAHPVLAAFAPVRAGEPQPTTVLPLLNAAHGSFRNADPFLVHPLFNGAPFKDRYGREMVQFSSGFGRTLVRSFDLLRAPIDTWAGRRQVWTEVLAAFPRWFQEDTHGFPVAATAQQRLDLFQQMARLINPYPSFGLILGLAGIFLLTVGPLNYVALWRLRRTILLVVTIPGISIAFLALILGLGYVLKGTTTVVHSARLLSTRSGLDCAREVHLFSLFSPSTRSYDVTCDPGTFGQPPARWSGNDSRYSSRRGETIASLTCETGSGLTLRGLGAGQWQSWDLETHALRELGPGVSFGVDGPVVRVTNGSSRVIERAVFIQSDREPVVVGFGEIGPGKSGEGRIDGPRVSAAAALGLEPDSLGDRLLRTWLETATRRLRPFDPIEEKKQRFLLCVLKNEGEPVRVDARVSDRSRAITLLHVAEGP
ncbi:MAG: hypothetical protein HY293_06250 [Planctomycetes bacterium]|nr:hypothetical protein [Planctomycetota bacterium]